MVSSVVEKASTMFEWLRRYAEQNGIWRAKHAAVEYVGYGLRTGAPLQQRGLNGVEGVDERIDSLVEVVYPACCLASRRPVAKSVAILESFRRSLEL